ncbi:FecR family protein [Paucidesulfovibrio gracilis DSM 16080]|uniref:FecR family protein n=1 Tax=Paucidesulfovibrio gracilis DSM 16080 TaxID=1121449 RepID=A0A1T4XNG1_9BACT|nr:FecR family protein [Paucidesulfovibrio gracilis]SKA90923.1 FecR family protein [Paucidesulfovibrio gracilis DSM 16080]
MWCRWLVLLLFLLMPCLASAAQEPVGEVQSLKGTAVAVRGETAHPLDRGEALYRSDLLTTGADSFLQVMFLDGTVITMDAHTQLAVNQVVYEPGEADQGRFDADVVAGTCRFLTGRITRFEPNNFKLGTPLGTIGIRGTEGGVHAPAGNPAYGPQLDRNIGSAGTGWDQPSPDVQRQTISHINGSVNRPMQFTDLFGKQQEVQRGRSLDADAQQGAGQPRSMNQRDRDTYSGSDFHTSATTPKAFRATFDGYGSGPGASNKPGGGSGGDGPGGSGSGHGGGHGGGQGGGTGP